MNCCVRQYSHIVARGHAADSPVVVCCGSFFIMQEVFASLAQLPSVEEAEHVHMPSESGYRVWRQPEFDAVDVNEMIAAM